MKNMFRIIAPIAIIALAASCAREIQSDSVSDVFRRYNITIDESTKTELSGTGSKRQVNWSEGDEIKYYTVSKQSSAASTAVNIAGSSAYVEIPRGRNDEFINAVYGAAQLKSSSSTESIMYITSPVKNAQRFTSFADAHVCAAFSDDIENPELKFHNVAPVFMFTSVAAVSKVVFRGNNDEIIAGGSNGDLKISYSGGAITTEASSTGGKSVTIATNGDALDFYFAVLPVSFANGITIDCYDADNALIFSKKAGGSINTVSGSGSVKLLNLGSVLDWIANAPPTAIDLGLSVKWASFNVGATKPEEYGDYFAWGEIAPKSEYKWANYQFGTSKNGPFSKYVLDSTYGTIDHKTVLDLADDAAHTAWGDDWRMPTKEEVSELMSSSNCTWTWTTKNGVPGYKVTSRKSGYTANSIFLPANGMKSGYSLSDGGTAGNYWTSSISVSFPYYAISPFFDSSKKVSDNCYRYFGLGVRPVQGAVIPVSSITIPETLTLIIGASGTLSATILPANSTYKNLTWTSSDESISMVDANGKVTSVAPGTATITAYSADGGITASCVVSSNQLTESITLDKTALEMYVGDEPVTLTATILPASNVDKSVTWSSSKTSVATVDQEGRVTAVANGTATITATAKDGSGAKATCSVTVFTHVESVSLNKTEVTLYNGKTTSLTATVLPSNASNKSVTWTSSDVGVATVSGSGSSATVKGISRGNAIITATSEDGEITSTCIVTVNQFVQSIKLDKTSLTMYVGDNPVLLSATISPENASDKSVTWTSSKPSVATVDEDGQVTAIAYGYTSITATAKDGSGCKASCSIYVYKHIESFSLNQSELSLFVGYSTTLAVTIQPSNTSNKSVTWTSSDVGVATVSGSGSSVTVRGVSRGNATITATSAESGIKASCIVTVNQPVRSIQLDKTSLTMYVGDNPVLLSVTISPENASDKSVTWTSSKTSVATVDEEGLVTAVSNGTTDITATANDGSGIFATCSVTVNTHVESISLNSEIVLHKNESASLTAIIKPSNASDKSVTWLSSDESVVGCYGEKVTGRSPGVATITATTVDGNYQAQCAVTVTDYVPINGHDYVDLGLPSGLKWATCNVGARRPENYGDYFAWGEILPKSNYTWTTYIWCEGNSYSFTKYNRFSDTGKVDNKTTLEPEDDVAHVEWGGGWRMPTESEWNELRNNCRWDWTDNYNETGVAGSIVTSNINGYSHRSIFIPAAGEWSATEHLYLGSSGKYWTSSLYINQNFYAWSGTLSSGFYSQNRYFRYYGRSVRPVTK